MGPEAVLNRAAARQRRLDALAEAKAKNPEFEVTNLMPHHKRAVDEYFANGCMNWRSACIEAGFSGHSAPKLWQEVTIQEEIFRRRARRARKTAVTEERIIEELAKVAFANFGDLLNVNEDGTAVVDLSLLTDEHKAALARYEAETITTDGNETEKVVRKAKIAFHDKLGALQQLARINGMFKDRVEVAVGLSLSDKVAQARSRLQRPTLDQEGNPV